MKKATCVKGFVQYLARWYVLVKWELLLITAEKILLYIALFKIHIPVVYCKNIEVQLIFACWLSIQESTKFTYIFQLFVSSVRFSVSAICHVWMQTNLLLFQCLHLLRYIFIEVQLACNKIHLSIQCDEFYILIFFSNIFCSFHCRAGLSLPWLNLFLSTF